MTSAERFNPFPGLRSFEEHEDHLFFGREKDLDELLRRLRTVRFLVVLGTSGCGKSSLVKSGLVPAICSGFMSRAGTGWRVALMRPGEDPIGRLAAALNSPEVLGDGDEELADMHCSILESTLRRGRFGLVECVAEARLAEHQRLLVVVDQFEELFRFRRSGIAGSRDDAVAFIRLLLTAADQTRPPIYLVLTLRSEFISNCNEIPGLIYAINRGQYLVPLLDRQQRRTAITGPVAVGGGAIRPRLVMRLLNDVGDDSDQLPILQHALMRTWDYWEQDHAEGETLDLRHYEAVGTLKHALDRHAEEAYAELGSELRQMIAERLFKCLTEKDPDSQIGVRRPSRLDEICEVSGAELEAVIAVVDVFRKPGRSFLTPPAGTELHPHSVIDISHESLMRVWKRLIRWVEEETEAASFYRRLSEAARHHREGTAALWRDPELTLGRQWQAKHRPTAAWAVRYDPYFERAIGFLDASHKEHRRRLTARERERRHKLRRARWLAAILGSAALVTLAFGVWAMHLRGVAESERAAAQEHRRIAEEQHREAELQRQAAEREREEALRQRGEADRQRDRAETERRAADRAREIAEEQRQVAETQRGIVEVKETEAQEQRRRAEDERRRAEDQRDKAERAEREARRLRQIAEARALAVRTLDMRDDAERQLAALLALAAWRINRSSGGEAEDLDVYRALRANAERLASERAQILHGHPGAVRALALAPNGRTLATGGEGGEVRLADLVGPREGSRAIGTLGGEVRALAFGRQGRRLAAASDGGTFLVWDLERGSQQVLAQGEAGFTALERRPGSDVLAAAGADGAVRLWDLGAADPRPVELASGAVVHDLAFSADGERLAGASDRGVLVWDVDAPAALSVVGEGTRFVSVAASRDSRFLAAGRVDGGIALWTLREGDAPRPGAAGPAELQGHATRVADLAFHPRRDLLASASFDGTLRLWDVERPDSLPLVLDGHAHWVWSIVFSPDGRRLVSASRDGTVRVWTTSSQALVEEICRRVGRALTVQERAEHLPEDVEYEEACPGRTGGGL